MNGKYLVGTVIETVLRVIVIAAVVIFVFRASAAAYDFGYRVFADQPVSVNGGRTITVGVAEDADIKDIAKMLEEKGLIEDAELFVVQELLSSYHGEVQPGIYDLNTGMTAEEMLAVMSAPAEDAKPEANQENRTEEEQDAGTGGEEEQPDEENTEGMTAQ